MPLNAPFSRSSWQRHWRVNWNRLANWRLGASCLTWWASHFRLPILFPSIRIFPPFNPCLPSSTHFCSVMIGLSGDEEENVNPVQSTTMIRPETKHPYTPAFTYLESLKWCSSLAPISFEPPRTNLIQMEIALGYRWGMIIYTIVDWQRLPPFLDARLTLVAARQKQWFKNKIPSAESCRMQREKSSLLCLILFWFCRSKSCLAFAACSRSLRRGSGSLPATSKRGSSSSEWTHFSVACLTCWHFSIDFYGANHSYATQAT